MSEVGDLIRGPWDGLGRITTGFKYRTIPAPHGGGAHHGYDVALVGGEGTKLYAALDGVILDCNDGVPRNPGGRNPGSGSPSNWILLGCEYQGKRISIFYQHLEKGLEVKKGQKVKRGQYIGRVGLTGNTSGQHLHIAVNTNPGDRYAHISGGYIYPPSKVWGGDQQSIGGVKPAPKYPGVKAVKAAASGKPAPWVKELKAALKDQGFDGMTMDDNYGPGLRDAVKKFQTKHKTKPTGLVGPIIWWAIFGKQGPRPKPAISNNKPCPKCKGTGRAA